MTEHAVTAPQPSCVARNPGNLDVAAFARMRAFPAFPHSGECGYCVLFNSEKEDWEHDVTRNLLLEPSGSQTHPVTLAGGR